MADLLVTIGADLADYNKALQDAGLGAYQFKSKAEDAFGSTGQAAQSMSMRMMQARSGMSAMRDGLIGVSIGGQAGERALMAMGHHITTLYNETGSLTGVLSALKTSMMSFGGVILVISLLAEVWSKFSEKQKDSTSAMSDFDKAVDSAVRSADTEIAKSSELYAAATNENLSRKDRLEAVRKLQNEYPSYFGNIDKEVLMAGKAKDAYDKLTQAMIGKAAVAAAQSKLEEAMKPLTDLAMKEALNTATAKQHGLDPKIFGGVPLNQIKGANQNTVSMDQNPNDVAKKNIEEFKQRQQSVVKQWQDTIQELIKTFGINTVTGFGGGDKKDQQLKDELELQKANLAGAKADALAIYSNENNSYQKRLDALKTYLSKSEQLIKVDGKLKESEADISGTKIAAIEKETSNDLTNLRRDVASKTQSLDKQANEKMIRNLKEGIKNYEDIEKNSEDVFRQASEQRLQIIDEEKANTLSALADQYSRGLIDQKEYERQKSDIEYQAGMDRLNTQLELYKQLKKLQQEFEMPTTKTDTSISNLNKQINELKGNKSLSDATKQASEYNDKLRTLEDTLGNGLSSAFEKALSGGGNFFTLFAQFLEQLVVKLIATAVAAEVLAVALSMTGFGAAMGASSSFSSIFGQMSGLSAFIPSGSSGIPGHATGGITTRAHLAMVGEGGEPEVIQPLSKLQEFINTKNSNMGGSLTAKVSGADLIFVLNNATKQNNRRT